jgi:hypothetical protein
MMASSDARRLGSVPDRGHDSGRALRSRAGGGSHNQESELVAYASEMGGTACITEAIGDQLLRCGHEVDVRDVAKVCSLRDYGVVVLGSAIYARGWPASCGTIATSCVTVMSGCSTAARPVRIRTLPRPRHRTSPA